MRWCEGEKSQIENLYLKLETGWEPLCTKKGDTPEKYI